MINDVAQQNLARHGEQAAASSANTPAYFSPKQAATYLNVSPTSIYALCKRGEIRHIRVGKAIRIRPMDLDSLGSEYEFQCLSLNGPRQTA